jgi:hypothetical protein
LLPLRYRRTAILKQSRAIWKNAAIWPQINSTTR